MTPSLALDSIEINNFRALRHLKLENLSRVNLIVGKNNVGKTTVLEAIWVYAQGGAPKALLEVLEGRNEASLQTNGNGQSKAYTTKDQFASLKYLTSLSKNHLDAAQNGSGFHPINISAGLNYPIIKYNLTIFVGPYKLTTSKDEVSGELTAEPEYNRGAEESLLIMHDQKKFDYPLKSGKFLEVLRDNLNTPPPPTIERNAYFARVQGFDIDQLDARWDDLLLRDSANDIVGCLQIITPEIERIHLVPTPGQSHRQPFAKLAGLDEPVSLKSLGEGLNRLFGVAVILVQSKGGIALIDEIDTGLHYSVLPTFWNFVFKAAQRLNVQVFATTHSWDCIEGFSEALQSDEGFDGQLISLRRSREVDDDTIYPVSYDRQEIAIATKSDIEVR